MYLSSTSYHSRKINKYICRGLYLYDPDGYRWPPTFSNWLKTIFRQFWQFTIFSSFNFRGHFHGLNEGFFGSSSSIITKGMIEPPKIISSTIPFQRAITCLKQSVITEISFANGYKNSASSNSYEVIHGPELTQNNRDTVKLVFYSIRK